MKWYARSFSVIIMRRTWIVLAGLVLGVIIPYSVSASGMTGTVAASIPIITTDDLLCDVTSPLDTAKDESFAEATEEVDGNLVAAIVRDKLNQNRIVSVCLIYESQQVGLWKRRDILEAQYKSTDNHQVSVYREVKPPLGNWKLSPNVSLETFSILWPTDADIMTVVSIVPLLRRIDDANVGLDDLRFRIVSAPRSQ